MTEEATIIEGDNAPETTVNIEAEAPIADKPDDDLAFPVTGEPTAAQAKQAMADLRAGKAPKMRETPKEDAAPALVEEVKAEENAGVTQPEEAEEQEAAPEEDEGEGHHYIKGKDGKWVNKGKMVPVGKFKSVREEAAAHKAEADFYKKQHQEQQQSIAALLAMTEKKSEVEAEPEIDPLDPEAYNALNAKIAKLEAALEKAQDAGNNPLAQQLNDLKAQIEGQQFVATMERQTATFLKATPDYQNAVDHLVQAKMIEIAYTAPQGTSREELAEKATIALGEAAYKFQSNGHNPAEAMYNLAKATGYAGKITPTKKTGPDLNKIDENRKKSDSDINKIKGLSPDTGDGGVEVNGDSFHAKYVDKETGMVDRARVRKDMATARRQYANA